MKYIPQIDGIRAIAIIAVVIYHAFPSALKSGYLGVDVFFVISGFLITTILHEKFAAQSFSYVEFYASRIRRLIPALTVVTCLTVLASMVIHTPAQADMTLRSAIASTFYVSNLFFLTELDYFSAASEFAPLLHTWSLSVEEQFYLIFPAVLVLLSRFLSRKRIVIALTGLGAFSLFVMWAAGMLGDRWEFFFSLGRAWEFIAGAICALIIRDHNSIRRYSRFAPGAAYCVLVFSIVFISALTASLVFQTVIVCLLTCIALSLAVDDGSIGNKFLGSRVLVYIGKVSYSLYLWHWPILSFARYMSPGEISHLTSVFCVLLSFLAAHLSYTAVEQPFRLRALIAGHHKAFAFLFAATTTVVCLTGYGLAGYELEKTTPPNLALWRNANFGAVKDPAPRECIRKNVDDTYENFCGTASSSTTVQVFLWGDSHALAIHRAFLDVAIDVGAHYKFAGKSACIPVTNLVRSDKRNGQSCRAFNKNIFQLIRESNVSHVVLHGRWTMADTGQRYGNEIGGAVSFVSSPPLASQTIFRREFDSMINELASDGTHITIIAGVPEVGLDLPRVSYVNELFGNLEKLAPSVLEYDARNSNTNKYLLSVAERHESVNVLFPHRILCSSGRCSTKNSSGLFYTDGHHLSHVGANALISEIIRPIITSPIRK